ncbi:Methyltransferase type 12 [Denitrovibrio acetiphilus DSM 12809]|uniref:Methyltransferase type 12 n=1 Tax=Denitrovibrio acetiphilus (strain DSM 12809 / NBRC 114555 / N2460) TaxID=522772 RepID=D4H3N7_DENA2|nr:methyltransferase domain-containing protein [Denitrovibrio acetiphilus]ADD69139.1 Methyltransferase type 12 [Denitrovibrio acetiphilus DSM 12809]
MNDSVQNYYNELASSDSNRHYKGIPVLASDGIHQYITDLSKGYLKEGASVLDIGCGQGALSLRLADNNYNVNACDSYDLCKCKDRINFINSMIEDLNTDVQFDGLFAVEVIEHVENVFQFLEIAKGLLKDDGYIFITTPNIETFTSKIRFLLTGEHALFAEHNQKQDGHINPVHHFQIAYACEKYGLKIVESTSILKERFPKNLFKQMLYGLMYIPVLFSKHKNDKGKIKVYVLEKA